MTREVSCHLLDMLAEVTDPRKDNRNTALSVLRFAGYTAISDTIKYLASKPKLAVNMIK